MDNLIKTLDQIFNSLESENKTIHCLTNPISINDMANVILSLNQSPIMADNPREVEEITKKSSSLLINLGNIQDYRMKAMKKAVKTANEADIPIVLDLVGVSASKLRLDFVLDLLKDYKFDLIKGNYSEIYSLDEKEISTAGVDSKDLDTGNIIEHSKSLNTKYKSIILASGKKDVIFDENNTFVLSNGDKRLKKITGTGCILGAISASTLAIKRSIYSVILAVSIENISSENIEDNVGMTTFKLEFLDNISLITMEKIKERIRYEKYWSKPIFGNQQG